VQASTLSADSHSESKELARTVAGFFLYVANASNRDLLPQISQYDISLTQLKALSQLHGRSEELSVKELAEGLGLSVAATSRAIDGLCKRGLVDRAEDAADRRIRRVRLTAKGRSTVERMQAIKTAALERLLTQLSTSERQRLAAALEPILDREEVRRFYRGGRAR